MIMKDDNFFMEQALHQARLALKNDEVPVGAVLVGPDGKILSKGYNKIEKKGCHTAHAEVIAIQKACKKKGGWRLDGCWLYVTLEPCLMCFGLINLSRIEGLVFGASSQFFGSGLGVGGSDMENQYNKNLIIKGGLKEKQSTDILKKFFESIRKKKRKAKDEGKSQIFGKS